jgi:cytochrome c peroxidase
MCRAKGSLVLLLGLGLAGCDIFPTDTTDAKLRALVADQGVTAVVPAEEDAAQVALGQVLFFDKILSGNRNISCSTCHLPEAATGDALPVSIGEGGSGRALERVAPTDGAGAEVLIPRNAPDVFNRGTMQTMFWDGRVALDGGAFVSPAGATLPAGLDDVLAVQAMFPVTSREEMRGQVDADDDNELGDIADDDFAAMWSALMDRLLAIAEYETLFAAAYPAVAPDALTFAHAANAIAAFEREHWTLDDAPFDKYLRGDNTALDAAEKRGALLFFNGQADGGADCARCHTGPMLTDEDFHNRVVPQLGPGKGDGPDGSWDFGRARETGARDDRFRFRTPPLRNVATTGPWMHSGAFGTLEAAVRHCADPVASAEAYDGVSLAEPFAATYRAAHTADIIAAADPDDLTPVTLSDAEIADLVAFLEALTSPQVATLADVDVPDSVPSGLPLAD